MAPKSTTTEPSLTVPDMSNIGQASGRRRSARTRTAAISGAVLALSASLWAAPPSDALVASGSAAPTWASRYNDCLSVFEGIDLQTATIPQLQAAMSAGRFTSRQLTEAYLTRIAAYNEGTVKINAIRTFTDDALAQADAADLARHRGRKGILLGIPVLLKDNMDTVDAPTTAGSIALAGNRPPDDAALVSQLRAAGAVILGKTNLSEFANWMSEGMPNGFSSLGGQVVNPYDQGDPSGSSSGSGAGGTMSFAAGTFGTETSGSILSPSTANSMVGIKPTVGLVSRNGIIPLAHSFDTGGPIARNVTDAAALLSAISAPDPSDVVNQRAPGGPPPGHNYLPYLKRGALEGARIGYSTADEPSDAPSAAVWNAALAALRADGATLVETDTLADEGNISLTELAGIPSEFKWGIADYLAHDAGPVGPNGRPALVSQDLTGIIAYNQEHSSQIPYGQSLLIASDATTGATQDDPSSAATIVAQRQVIDSMFSANALNAYVAPDAAYAGSGAAAGYPSVTVPDGYTSATVGTTPHGIQFLGVAWSEPTLIGLAYSFEQSTNDRVPATVNDPALTSSYCSAQAAHVSFQSMPAAITSAPVASEPRTHADDALKNL
jgi:amidase